MSYELPRDPTAVIGRRIAAYVIDAIILGVITFVAVNATFDSYDKSDLFVDIDVCDSIDADICWEDDNTAFVFETSSDALIGIGVPLLAHLGNFVVLQGLTGASIGKHLMGLRVVNQNGQLAGVGRVSVRWLAAIVEISCCFLIGLITMLVSKGHRRVGDMIAGTYVVSALDVGTPPFGPGGAVPPMGYPPGPPAGGWAPPTTGGPPPGSWSPPPNPGPPPPTDPGPPPPAPGSPSPWS